ncbi:spore gernimation protein GerC [Desulfosporosinus sp. Tol-M]|nr:spore gernimation protein GerC [Desulfosporosinus sp. Tol-M]
MKGLKHKLGVLILIVCILLLDGCWDKKEVESVALLMGAGIDLGRKPGTYLLTAQFALPQKGGAAGSDIESWTYSAEVSSIREFYEMVSKSINRVPFEGSQKVVVIGEDAAKAGFINVLDFVQRYSEFRRTMYLVLAKGKAQSILNTKLGKGQLPAMFIKSNIETSHDISVYPTVRLGHYLTILGRKSTAPILPVVESIKPGEGIGGNQVVGTAGEQEMQLRLQGAGVLRGDHLADFLTDEETKGFMWLDNSVGQRFISTVGSEESEVNFVGQALKSTTKFKVSDKDGTIGIEYRIKASLEVDEVLGLKEQLSSTEWAALLKEAEKSFAKVIEKECELSIKKEKELSLDFLGIGRHIEQQKPAYWQTVKDQWEQKIADFPVSLDVQVTIHHSGMSKSSPTTNSTGEGAE